MARLSRESMQLWAAARTVAMHAAGTRCAHCQPDGSCRLYQWADTLLLTWESTRGQQYPREPAWRPASSSGTDEHA